VAIVAGTLAPAAVAQVSGNCAISVGNDLIGTATVKVDDDASVTVSGQAPPFSTTEMFLNFLGARVKIAEAQAGSDGTWSKTVDVKDYAKWGTGLYTVDWKRLATTASAESTCTADVLVEGEFFGTPMAWVSSALLAVGAAGLILTLTSTISIFNNKNGKWDAKVKANAKSERDEEGKMHLRLGYSIRKTLVSTLWGFLAGGAAFALCVGEAVGPPSVSVALSVTLPLTLVGVFLGQGRLWAERRLLRRLSSPPPPATEPAPAPA
jgi:hypothetical protein